MSPVAAMLCAVQAGQSGQPRPDWLSRTAAPVRMISAEVMSPASAHRRMAAAVGASSHRPASGPGHGARARDVSAGNARAGGRRVGGGQVCWHASMVGASGRQVRARVLKLPAGGSQPPGGGAGIRRPADPGPGCRARLRRRRRSPGRSPPTAWPRSASPSSTRPTSAATAGSRLIQMPNVPAGTRRSASSSSRYGMTEDSSPIASALGERRPDAAGRRLPARPPARSPRRPRRSWR